MRYNRTLSFFDAPKVLRKVDRATRRVLSKFGSFVRTRSRSSIRKRKGPSEPGSPPHGHTGLLKRGIFFAFEARTRNVVIGPELLPGKRQGNLPLLEYGGVRRSRKTRYIRVKRSAGRDRTTGRSTSRGTLQRIRKGERLEYEARPFMQPAMDAELPGLPRLWRDSVR